MNVEQIADAIVAREGGFVNDPDDPGGATNFGVTIGTMRRLKLDKTGDGRITVADVRALTRADAKRIFMDSYYRKPKIDHLPEIIQASVFDMQVNAGGNAVKILQRLMVLFGEKTAVDGAIGPNTIAAAKRIEARAGAFFADAYGIARRNYYFALADRRAASRKYARRRDGGKGGWITRAEEFISPRYRLSGAQFDERVSAWG